MGTRGRWCITINKGGARVRMHDYKRVRVKGSPMYRLQFGAEIWSGTPH